MDGIARFIAISLIFHAAAAGTLAAGAGRDRQCLNTPAVFEVSLRQPDGDGVKARHGMDGLPGVKADIRREAANLPAEAAKPSRIMPAGISDRGSNEGESRVEPENDAIAKGLRYNMLVLRETEEPGPDSLATGEQGAAGMRGAPGGYGSNGRPSGTGDASADMGGGAGHPGKGGFGMFGAGNGPKIVEMARPVYPVRARRVGVDGRVVLCLCIGRDGVLTDVTVVEPAGYGMDEAAVEAVKRSRFGPATKDGCPVDSRALLPIRFELADAGR